MNIRIVVLGIALLLVSGCRGPKPTIPLRIALSHGNVDEVHANLQWPDGKFMYGINDPMDKTGVMPLHLAARSGQLEVVKYLLAHGASINSFGAFGHGCTPLQLAEEYKHAAVAAFLKEKGAKDYPLRERSYIVQQEKDAQDKKERKKIRRTEKRRNKNLLRPTPD
ncbi:MAG: ankyrin repeat domain-containing protein [Phycisphaerales bacterium]|nr:ankyrin repeat domain-containing protein [Phycisphaerales bacterium]